jgi:hypothetical protein
MTGLGWNKRSSYRRPAVTSNQREVLDRLATVRVAPHREVTRAPPLLVGGGLATIAMAHAVAASSASLTDGREQFAAAGPKGFQVVREGRGRKPSIPTEKMAAIVHAMFPDKPDGETHWSYRSLARAQGVSSCT